jgi:CheY-like chemotaxis protein
MTHLPGNSTATQPKTVLLVDDDPLIRSSIHRMLTAERFEVVPACHGPHALELWEQRERPFDLVLTDLEMPGMSGFELVRHLSQKRKGLIAVYITGFPELIDQATDIPANLFLQKPFTATELGQKVRAAINTPLEGWQCPRCGADCCRGLSADNDEHTLTLAFACNDCGAEYVKKTEVLHPHATCPFCSGLVELSGYGFVGGKEWYYLEQRCRSCDAPITMRSPSCLAIPW